MQAEGFFEITKSKYLSTEIVFGWPWLWSNRCWRIWRAFMNLCAWRRRLNGGYDGTMWRRCNDAVMEQRWCWMEAMMGRYDDDITLGRWSNDGIEQRQWWIDVTMTKRWGDGTTMVFNRGNVGTMWRWCNDGNMEQRCCWMESMVIGVRPRENQV